MYSQVVQNAVPRKLVVPDLNARVSPAFLSIILTALSRFRISRRAGTFISRHPGMTLKREGFRTPAHNVRPGLVPCIHKGRPMPQVPHLASATASRFYAVNSRCAAAAKRTPMLPTACIASPLHPTPHPFTYTAVPTPKTSLLWPSTAPTPAPAPASPRPRPSAVPPHLGPPPPPATPAPCPARARCR